MIRIFIVFFILSFQLIFAQSFAQPRQTESIAAIAELSHIEDNKDVSYNTLSGGLTFKRDFFGLLSSLGFLISKMKSESSSAVEIENVVTHVFGAIPFTKSYAEFDVMTSSSSDRSAKYGVRAAYYLAIPSTNFELGSGLRYSEYEETNDFTLNESLGYYVSDAWLVLGGVNLSLKESDFRSYRAGLRFTGEIWKLDLGLATGEGPIDVGVVDKFKSYSLKVSRAFGAKIAYLAVAQTDGDIYSDDQLTGGFQWAL